MRPYRSNGIRPAAWVLALLLLGSAPVLSDEQGSLEYRVKAAFVVNFAKFTTWPERSFAGPTSPLVICIIGDDPFGEAFVPFQGTTVAGRTIEIKRLAQDEEVTPCHVLFIASSETGDLGRLAALAGRSSVLTVTDIEGSCGQGPIICLYPRNKRISFDIDNARARRSDLIISAKLLSLARRVMN